MDEVEALHKALEMVRLHNLTKNFPLIGWKQMGEEWAVEIYAYVAAKFSIFNTLYEPENILDQSNMLDGVSAYKIARAHAQGKGMRWESAYTLEREGAIWTVGAVQSQLGGQTYVDVGDDGLVKKCWINRI